MPLTSMRMCNSYVQCICVMHICNAYVQCICAIHMCNAYVQCHFNESAYAYVPTSMQYAYAQQEFMLVSTCVLHSLCISPDNSNVALICE